MTQLIKKTQRKKAKNITKNKRGFSLIELMISMAIGMILTSGAVSMFTGSLKHTNEFVSLTKLDQELQGIMELIAKEIRRTGYDGDSSTGGDTDFGVNSSSTSNCLLYSYDSNTSGNVGSLDNNERYGIRYNGNNIYFGSNVTSCSGGGWNTINDENVVQISGLTFVENNLCLNLVNGEDCTTNTPSSGDKILWKKQIQVTISGNATNNTDNFTRTIKNTVRMHSDILETYP